MRKFILTVALSVSLAPMLFAGIAEARQNFERTCGAAFSHTVLFDQEVVADAQRYDKAPGKVKFVFAMPYATDRRLQFVIAEFDSGKFVSAQLRIFGLDPKPIDAAAFEKLRDERPIVGVREDVDDVGAPSVFYASRASAVPYRATDEWQLNPVARQLGCLGGALGRLDIDTKKLAYRVFLTGKDGLTVDLGVATSKEHISVANVLTLVRKALEDRYPARKGMVSDRDVVDWRQGSCISFKAERQK